MSPEFRTELEVYGGKVPYTLVVEPWADEFEIRPGDRCKVVAIGSRVAAFGIEHHPPEYLVLYVNEGGATFEFWRGATQER